MPYKMSDGRWRGHKMIGGRRRTKVFDNKGDAVRWEVEQTAEAWAVEQAPATPTVFLWANEYLTYVKERHVEHTYKQKRRAFANLLRIVGAGCYVCAVSPGVALQVLKPRVSVSGGAANKDRRDLRAGWEWGRRHLHGWPDMPNPFAKVDKFPEDHRPRYVPPEADFWRAVERGCTTDAHRAFLLVMLFTAARLGELCRLRWDDVDAPGRRIRLFTRKRSGGGLEADWLPLAEPAARVLARLPRTSDLVFPGPGREQYTQRQHIMLKICRRAGVRHFGFHAVRHLSASVLARENVPLPVIQAILRHRSATTTAIYLRSLGVDLPEINRVWEGRQNHFAHNFAHDQGGNATGSKE